MTDVTGERAVLASDIVRSYKRAASRLRDILDGPPGGLDISFRMQAGKDEPTTSSLALGNRVDRHAALLRPFMAARSVIELRKVWALLEPVTADAVRAPVESEFERADRLFIPLKLNERALTARDVYFAYGEGEYFAEDPAAKELGEALSVGPMHDLLPMLFHEACAGYSRLVFVVLEVLLQWERVNSQPSVRTERDTKCIYCLVADGDFGPEEHVIPESLVGDETVLIDSVCASCNNRLSQLDQALLEFEPVAFLRTVYGPLTKKGKFPQARFREFDIERTAPRALRLREKSGRKLATPEDQGDGTVRFTIAGSGRKPFDAVLLGRALFKIGLGMLSHDAGRDAALDPRYDGARHFVLDAAPIATHLVMSLKGKPHASIQTWVRPSDVDTVVVLDIFGLLLMFNLEPIPIAPMPEGVEGAFARFWLGAPETTPELP